MSISSVNTQGRIVDDPVTTHNNEGVSVNAARLCAACGRASKGKYCGAACYHAWQRSRPVEARFWAKVKKTPTCWIWQGARGNEYGHGYFFVRREGRPNVPTYAHRVAWELTHGPIPDGRHVLHNCPGGDNPRCVNPAHLFLGDQAANMKDAASKGRFSVPHPRTRKVTDEQIAEMFSLRQQGLTLEAIGAEFDVTKAFVSFVLRGKRRVYTAPQLAQPHAKASGF